MKKLVNVARRLSPALGAFAAALRDPPVPVCPPLSARLLAASPVASPPELDASARALQAAAGRAGRERVGETIPLVGAPLRDLKLIGCTLVYDGAGPVTMSGCDLNDTRFEFQGAAANTLSFLKALAADPGTRELVRASFPELT